MRHKDKRPDLALFEPESRFHSFSIALTRSSSSLNHPISCSVTLVRALSLSRSLFLSRLPSLHLKKQSISSNNSFPLSLRHLFEISPFLSTHTPQEQ